MLIVRRAKLYYTASGIITPIGGRPVERLREDGQRNIYNKIKKEIKKKNKKKNVYWTVHA